MAKEALNYNSYDKRTIEYIFPELKESEDERIRKELLEYLKRKIKCSPLTDKQTELISKSIAWLEKQGEKNIPKNIDDAALQYVDTCAVDGEVTHDNITEPYWNNHSMMNAYKAGWLEKQPAWGEEDEMFLNLSIVNLTELKDRFGEEYGKVGDCLAWLESLKERMKGE